MPPANDPASSTPVEAEPTQAKLLHPRASGAPATGRPQRLPRPSRVLSILTAVSTLLGLVAIDPAPVAAVEGSTTPESAPTVCDADTLDATYSEVGTAPVYGRAWVPAGASTTFVASGAILPSTYVGNGRGEYKMFVRVRHPDTGAALWEKWNFANVGVVWGPGPYGWVPFSGLNIGTWENTTGATTAFVIEMWAERSYAGADLRWSVDMAVPGGATSQCLTPHPLSENFGANLAMPGQCTRGTTKNSVDTQTGNEHFQLPGLEVAGRGPGLEFRVGYNSFDADYAGPVGFGWRHSYDMQLGPERDGTRTVYQETGATVTFTSNGVGGWSAPARFEATLAQNADSTWSFQRNRFQLFTFDATGRLGRVADRNGYATSLVYAGGLLDYVEDSAGRRLDFSWTAGLVSSITDPLAVPEGPRTITFSYSGGKLTGYRDVGGGLWVLGYDGARRLTSVRSPRHSDPAKAAEYHYDAQGRVDWEEDEANRRTSLYYDDPVAKATRVVFPDGDQRVDWYNAAGQCTKVTMGYGTAEETSTERTHHPDTFMVTSKIDGRGKQWHYAYGDPANPRHQTSVTDPLGRTRSLTYNALGLVTSTTDGAGTVTTFDYDTAGNLEKLTSAAGTALQAVTDLVRDPARPDDVTATIDARGHTWGATYAPTTGTRSAMSDPEANTTTFEYNTIGWLSGVVAPEGNKAGATPADHRSTNQYNRRGDVTRATNALGQATVTAFDPNGNLTSVTDPDGDMTTFTYTAADEVNTRTVGANTAAAATTTYQYFPDGNLRSWSKGAGAVWSYGYDSVGRRSSATDPDGDTTTFAYDDNANPVSVTQPGGNCGASPPTGCVSYSHDDANQLTGVDYSDPATADIALSYDNAGRRRYMSDGTGTSEWVWDALGRLDRHTDGAAQTVNYTWDTTGNLDAILYPHQSVPVDYGYDRAGRMTSVTDWLANRTDFGYDANANLTTATYPADTATADAFSYDRANRLSSTSWNHSQRGTMGKVDYTRDSDGLVASAAATGVPVGPQTPGPETYGYDTRDQLETVGSAKLSYDALDNLTGMSDGARQAFDADSELTGVHPAITVAGTAQVTDSALAEVALALPSGIRNEDQILLIASMPAAESVTAPPAGYTEVTSQLGGSSRTVVYRRTATGGEQSAIVGFSGRGLYDKSLMAVVYRGVDPTAPVAALQSAATAGNARTVTVGSVDAVRPATKLVMIESASSTLAFRFTQPSGMQERLATNGVGLASAVGDQSLAAAGPTGPRTAAYGLSSPLLGIVLALNPEHHTYSYDARGNRTGRTTRQATTNYAYDQADRLVAVDGAVSYGYDGDGLRTSSTTATGTDRSSWTRAGGLPLLLTQTPLGTNGNAAASKAVSYVYGPGGRLLTRIDPRPDITLVGARGAADAGVGNSLTVALPPGVVADDQVLVSVTHDNDSTASAPAGYTEVATRVGPSSTMRLWRHTAAGREASVTVNLTSNAVAVRTGVAAVYRGVDPNDPIADQDGASAQGSTVTIASLDAQGGDRLVGFAGAIHLVPSLSTWTPPSGMTQQAQSAASNASAVTADQALAATGSTGTRTFAYASSSSLVAAGVVLRRAVKLERWHHADHLGSTRLLTDQGGRTVGTATYDAYGRLAGSTGERSDFGFAGEHADPTTGLVYLRARWYDPATGQFMSRDPLVSVSLDPYGYAHNNPVNFVDPLGEFGIPILAAIAVFEIGSTLWDAYDAYRTFSNDCSGSAARWLSGGALLAGVLLPGGGYGSLDDLSRTGTRIIDGQLTRAGQKLEQHQGGLFPKVLGSAAKKSALGQHVLDDILTHPGTREILITSGNFKGGRRYIDPSGRGATFDASGQFQYFGTYK